MNEPTACYDPNMKPKMEAWLIDNSILVVKKDSFEHLLNCLDNQKFIHDVNADGMSEGEEKVKSKQAEMQSYIDDFNRQGRELLSPKANSGSIKTLEEIDYKTSPEGRLLFAALTILTTENHRDKTPDQVIGILNDHALSFLPPDIVSHPIGAITAAQQASNVT